tara:strand:- start:8298 stop:9485 length:1188 start_codon:yes stop_codon:yes gene_type:complete
MNSLKLIDRKLKLFNKDISSNEAELSSLVENSKFLVIGGAGSIGQAVTKEIFKRNPNSLHVVDINENNLVELVRDIRSSMGYIDGDFRTFAIDCGSSEFDAFINDGNGYDFVLNLSALKHVRSEKDRYTLMRLINVNIINTIQIAKLCKQIGVKKYFCVSTDKAANPVNMMGASKRIMEMFLMQHSERIDISTARFANVAFSDGSLLHGFNQRFLKNQPIAAPNDVKRYFVTSEESGQLCLMSCLLGENRDIYFPKLSPELNLTRFSDIAKRFLDDKGYEVHECSSENDARSEAQRLIKNKKWPCYFFKSDTTGEKDFEEFYTSNEIIDLDVFENIGVIKNDLSFNQSILNDFLDIIHDMQNRNHYTRKEIITLFNKVLPDFNHKEEGKFLDERM